MVMEWLHVNIHYMELLLIHVLNFLYPYQFNLFKHFRKWTNIGSPPYLTFLPQQYNSLVMTSLPDGRRSQVLASIQFSAFFK